MTTPDVNVVLLDFKKTKGREMVVPNEDGSYTILINSRLSYNNQLLAYEHAIKHIENDDFQKHDVQAIEAVAHNLVIPDDAERIPAQRYKEAIERLREERRKLKRQMKRYEKKIDFLYKYAGGEQGFFDRAENQKLYGDDL